MQLPQALARRPLAYLVGLPSIALLVVVALQIRSRPVSQREWLCAADQMSRLANHLILFSRRGC